MQWYPVSHQDRADTGGVEMIMGRKRERETGVEKFRHAAFCRVRGFRIIGACETLENKYHCNSDDFFYRPLPSLLLLFVSFYASYDTRYATDSVRLPPIRPRVDEKQIHFQPNYTRLSFTDLRHYVEYHFPRTIFSH